MSIVLSGIFSRETAQALSDRATNSDALGYPAAASFVEPEDSEDWHVNIYPLQSFNMEALVAELGEDARSLTENQLPDEVDWVVEGLKSLKPITVGRFFIHGAHDRALARSHHHAIQIDANQAFGTGHHGTTAGCLEAIETVTRKQNFNTLLDLGTGSGILAAALAKQTRKPVLATDIDPIAINVARENMHLNKIASLVRCETAPGFHHPVFAQHGPFDLVIANILARPLQILAQPMSSYLADNAIIILSGLLIRQKAAVLSAYREQGVILKQAIHREGWATLILNRP